MLSLLSDYITATAHSGLQLQSADGSMPAGNNGPYLDPETPVRNTGHWLIIFLKAYEISGVEIFKEAASNNLKYLFSKDARPMNATFYHRKNPKKDSSNGLMGQAWSIEALLYAYKVFGEDKILKLAEEIFLLHPYDKNLKGWEVVNVDGSIRTFDLTYNHQLWFAAVGSLLAKHGNSDIANSTTSFINAIDQNIAIYKDGVIKHKPLYFFRNTIFSKLRANYEFLRLQKADKNYIYRKSVGYHGFNLYALGMIKENFEGLPLFSSTKFNKMLKVIFTPQFKVLLNDNKYAYPYNPAGIEIAYALQQFGLKQEVPTWLETQMHQFFDFEKNLMNRNNPFDMHTAAARIYETYRLNDYALKIYE